MNFTVGIYNAKVRECIREGDIWNEEESNISADFSEVLYFDYPNCASVEQAEKIAEHQFPKAMGFRIDFIKSF
tara:strand:- start:74 stop:292 length:219 start_codon:yes stop_codon:yes gene_type:complete